MVHRPLSIFCLCTPSWVYVCHVIQCSLWGPTSSPTTHRCLWVLPAFIRPQLACALKAQRPCMHACLYPQEGELCSYDTRSGRKAGTKACAALSSHACGARGAGYDQTKGGFWVGCRWLGARWEGPRAAWSTISEAYLPWSCHSASLRFFLCPP